MLLRNDDTLIPDYTVPHPSYLHIHSRKNLKIRYLNCWNFFGISPDLMKLKIDANGCMQ